MGRLNSKQKWDKHPSVLHVFLIGRAKESNVLGFLRPGGGDHGEQQIEPAGRFERDAPRQKEQQAIQRVADVPVCARRDDGRRLFKLKHRQVIALGVLFSHLLEQTNAVDDHEQRDDQREPEDQLVPGEEMGEPMVKVEQSQRQDRLPLVICSY